MTFNPVKRIREKRYPTADQAQLAERLQALAALPPAAETPYLSIALDWRPDGQDPESRGAIQQFEQAARRLQQEHWPRGSTFDSIGSDIERVSNWLSNDVDPSTQGVFIVANGGAGVFEAISLGMPLTTRTLSGPVPALFQVARLDEDNPTYAVLLADQQQAHLSIISQSRRVESLTMASSDYPRKQQSGGWSQRRFQQRADERIMALGRRISSETERYLDERGVDLLILAGDEVITGALNRTMPVELQQSIIATIRLDASATAEEIIEATMPIAEKAEAEREAVSVQTVADLTWGGTRVATGSGDVIEALATGRASHLILNEDFHEDGWADFAHQRYGAGDNRKVFAGVSDDTAILPILVEEEMVRLAIRSGAEIDVIHTGVPAPDGPEMQMPEPGAIPRSPAASRLDEFGGVAAILRY